MEILLTDDEVRVLGCLMEKEMATPDYYPLTLNALTTACNQKSNRNPVVSYDEETVIYALNGLKERQLVRQSNLSRAVKYEQLFSNSLKLVTREQAIICTLLLRGPQTAGEIRSRTDRLYSFSSLDEVQETITSLEDLELILKLPKQPGRKESRYGHLLSGTPEEATAPVATIVRHRATAPSDHNFDNTTGQATDKTSELQEQIDELRREMQELQAEFESFKSQFE